MTLLHLMSSANLRCSFDLFHLYFVKPEFFVGYSLALDQYCDASSLNCLRYAEALDIILRGMTSTRLTGAALTGWIDEPWAKKGASRSVFFQRVIARFCPDFIEPLLARANQDLITVGFDFWSDPGTTNCIYRTFSTLLAFDWSLVGFIGSQDAHFIQRLNRQSCYEFQRAKKFLENFSQFCDYRNMKLKTISERFDVSIPGIYPI